MFGKLQQRKGARQNKERGGEERQKDKKDDRCKQKDIPTHYAAAAALLVNYSREREQDRTKKEVERKDRKIQKGR